MIAIETAEHYVIEYVKEGIVVKDRFQKHDYLTNQEWCEEEMEKLWEKLHGKKEVKAKAPAAKVIKKVTKKK